VSSCSFGEKVGRRCGLSKLAGLLGVDKKVWLAGCIVDSAYQKRRRSKYVKHLDDVHIKESCCAEALHLEI